MKGLVHYSDDSSPEASSSKPSHPPPHPLAEAGPSRLREPSTASPSTSATGAMTKKARSKLRAGLVPSPSPSTSSNPKPSKRPRQSPPPLAPAPSSATLPENLTHTAQSDLPISELSSCAAERRAVRSPHGPKYEGLTEDQVFRAVTRPAEMEGIEDWGIPPAVDPSEASDQLKAKVNNFLKLKYERGEHINTRLLSSSAFANPHIYSKLVEFVQIDERASAFPSGSWLTRQNLESQIPTFGPAALSARQKAREEQVKAGQATSKREIKFAPPRYREEEKKKDRNGWDKEKDRERGGHRERDRGKDRERARRDRR